MSSRYPIPSMHLSNSALRAELGTVLERLQASLQDLADHIERYGHDAWLWQPPASSGRVTPSTDLSQRQTLSGIAAAIQGIKYEDGQDAHESRIYPGIVALSPRGVGLADEVNRHKSALARVLRAMDGRTELGTIDQRTGERGERPLREVALEAFYFRRLHHWQATRRLEVLRETEEIAGTLEYVGFMWATSREVRRTSREALIEQATAPDATLLTEKEIQTLKDLPANEPLAIVRPGHTTPKANLRWLARNGDAATTKVRVAVLPLILPGNQLPARLRKLPPTPAAKQPRLSRTDIEIEPTPLCRSLPVYRYLKPLRAGKRKHDPRRL
jgi:DNA replication terminus site-binding protein (Ter protein)